MLFCNSTISASHGIGVVPSYSGFNGSKDVSLAYRRVTNSAWESIPNASMRSNTNIWTLSFTGVTEGAYSANLRVITTDVFYQRPALYLKHLTI